MDIVLDTSAVATDTIDYVATDPTGVAVTSTRTIIVEPVVAPSSAPNDSARSIAAATIPQRRCWATPRAGVDLVATHRIPC